MRKYLWPAIVIAVFAVLVAAGILMRSWLWGGAAIVMAAVLLNGFIATLEDDLADGASTGSAVITPRYIRAVAWVVRGIGVAAVVAIGCVAWLARTA